MSVDPRLSRLLPWAIAVLLIGCDGGGQQTTVQAPPPSVTVVPVTERQVTNQAEFLGRTEAVESVELRARVTGFLEQRNFEEGSTVEAGDLLFLIERAPYEAALARAEAELSGAQATLERAGRDVRRMRPLAERGDVSAVNMDQAVAAELEAQAAVKAAEAAVQQANLDLSYTEIRAPIDGRIGRSEVTAGNVVGPDSGQLARLVKLEPIYVSFTISERDMLDYRQQRLDSGATEGDGSAFEPRIRLANNALYPHAGHLDFVDNVVDPTTAAVTLRATFENPERLLLPGQFVTVILEESRIVDKRVVPQAAIQEDQAGRFVLVVNDQSQVEVRRVTVGERTGTEWVIEDGLTEGELVIYEGVQKVRPGVTVDPVSVEPPRPDEE